MFNVKKGDLVIHKGFVVSVVSWENDGDNYRTENEHFDTLKEAELFVSIIDKHSDVYGNDCSDYRDTTSLDIPEYTQEELDYMLGEGKLTVGQLLLDIENEVEAVLDDVFEAGQQLCYTAMGGSECYICRVLADTSIFEVKETVTFKNVG